MSAQLTFKDLATEMETGYTTNGYDVLVAYSNTKLNEFLQARAGHLPLQPVHFEVDGKDRSGPYTLIIHLELNGPVLNFQNKNAHLTFDVEGGYSQYKGSEATPLPAGVLVVLDIELCHIAGRVDETGQFKATTNAQGQPVDSKPSGEKVVLNPSDNSARGVCIDMSHVKATLKAKEGAGDDAKEVVNDLMGVRTHIENHFMQASSVEYYLAGTSTKSQPHDLEPRSFSFSISAGEGEEAALCMWIGVKEGVNNSSGHANFHPAGYDRSPIPTGSTASIVIHHDLLWKKFLGKNLEKFADLTAEVNTDKDAYRAECNLVFPDYHQKREEFSEMIGLALHYRSRGEIRFSAKRKEAGKKNTTVSIHRAIATSSSQAAAMVFKSDIQTVIWAETFGKSASSGTAYVTFEWGIRGKWSNGVNDGANPNTIRLDWENDKNWSISGTGTSTSGTMGGFDRFQSFLTTSRSDHVPPRILKTNVPAPNIETPVWNSLDYFLTTNLLYPGKQMFRAHEIGKQDCKGLAVPFDLILTGDLNTTA